MAYIRKRDGQAYTQRPDTKENRILTKPVNEISGDEYDDDLDGEDEIDEFFDSGALDFADDENG